MSVSVVIPCYNEPQERIEATVTTARHAIVEAGGGGEIVLIDDGSAQPPRSIACPWVRYYRTEHRGIAHALNRGVEHTRGEWVCWLSVGDSMDPSKLRRQRTWMEEHGYAASFHDYRNGPGPEDVYRCKANWYEKLERDNQFCGSTAMVTREVAVACPWNESLTYAVDWDWACSVHFDGPGWHYLRKVLGAAYELEGGHSWTAEAMPELWEVKCQDRATVRKRWHKRTLRGSRHED